MFANGSVPKEVGIGCKPLVVFLCDFVPMPFEPLTFLVQLEDHYIAGNDVHVIDSINHLFILLSFRVQFRIIGQYLHISLHSHAFDIAQLRQNLINVIKVLLLIETLSIAKNTRQPSKMIIDVILRKNIFCQTSSDESLMEAEYICARKDSFFVEIFAESDGFV